MTIRAPLVRPGQAVGLLGGSFDPPHAGHVHITLEALKRFGLDAVWWLVSPGNPLKSKGPVELPRRMAAARAMMQHPRVHITDLESQIGVRYTAETLEWLQNRHLQVRFVWLMGADNLAEFHRWERWDTILETTPIGVLARPGYRITARTSRAAMRYAAAQVSASASHLLPHRAAPAWCFINVPMIDLSSTALRDAGAWPRVE